MIDEAPTQGGFSIKEIARERQFLGPRNADHPAELLGQAPARHNAHSCMGIGKARGVARDQHIAGQRHFKAAGYRHPVDRPDHRF